MFQTRTKSVTTYGGLICLIGLLTLGAPPYARAADTAVLATAEGEVAGMRVDVKELKRNTDGTVTLTFVMMNDTHQPRSVIVLNTYLIDGVHKKKYPVVKDTQGQCVCATAGSIQPQSQLTLWATFPAPPENVQKLTVVVPHFSPMPDVPLR